MERSKAPSWCAVVIFLAGCSNEPGYLGCELNSSSANEAVALCSTAGEGASCVVAGQIQCDSRVCARYQGSDPFCTWACDSDADCEDGACAEFVLGSGERYCVQESYL